MCISHFSVLHAKKDQTDDHQCTHAHTCITLIHTQYYDNFGMPDLQTAEIEQPELRNLKGK